MDGQTDGQIGRQTDKLYHVELVPDTVTSEIPTLYTVQQQQNILLYYYCDNRRIVYTVSVCYENLPKIW